MRFLPRLIKGTLLAGAVFMPLLAPGWQMKTAPLMTDYAQQVNPANPLPEYPRPQMTRTNWLNLNGVWQFQAGATNDPVPVGQTLSDEILVPFPMESAISGVQAYHPFSWYRRTFTVPAAWSGQRLLLHLDAVDWESEVFINGTSVGVHRGGYDPATYDITPYVTGSGPQELIVRVYDPTDNGGQPRGKQTLHPGGIMYTSCSGIWQPVWLEPVPATCHIAGLKLVPDIDQDRLAVTANVAGDTSGITVTAVARAGGNVVGAVSGPPNVALQLPVPNPQLWCPTNPFLYDLDVTLSNSVSQVDAVGSYFGMRKISLGTNDGFVKIFLNNRFVFEFGPLDQGFWPDGIYTAPTDLALKSDLEYEKALGFNMVRKHIKVERARWYYWADKLGLLVWQDMPSANSYTGSPQPIDTNQFNLELERMVTNHWNHPSIVMWILFNEGQGQHDTPGLVSEIKALDPSRLVNQASGGDNSFHVGDIADIHSYPDPGYLVSSNQAVVCGEFGGVGLGITNHTWATGWGYVAAANGDDLASKFEGFAQELSDDANDHGLSAAVYTQITDVETELNGLLTYDRKVLKPDRRRIEAAVLTPLAEFAYAAVVPTSQAAGQTWQYTTAAPAANWTTPGFNDSSWSSGPGGFGTAGTPGAVVRTTWNTADIWLRRTFNPGALTAEQVSNLVFDVYHDEDVEIYLNGVLAYSAAGYTTTYLHLPINAAALAALATNAVNTLAVHCHQTSGGQNIDAGLDLKSVVSPAPPLPPPPAWVEDGTGLQGDYFNGTDLTDLVTERTDPTINFNWGNGSPAAGVSNDWFSARWTGWVQPRYTESYTFHLTADDGCRLWVGDQLLIDKWHSDSGSDAAGSIALVGGQKYPIRIEYYEATTFASARLEWDSASQRREVVPTGVLFATTNAPPPPSATNLPPTAVAPNRAPLLATPFVALPLGSVRPQGWLLTQCARQRDGLTGNAETVYANDLGTNSGWLGGTGESWERGPYYFRGLVALAYTLNDAGLKQKAQKWMDWLLDHQRPDGSIGPTSNDDWWPRMVATDALKDYYEATADPRVPLVLSNYFNYMRLNLPSRPLSSWGKARAGDEMNVALWLYNRNGDPNLLTLVNLLHQQAYDWPGIMASNDFMLFGTDFQPKHNVNVEEALKLPAVYYQLSKNPADRDALAAGLANLMNAHGLSCGINSGTEFLSGNASVQGVELCAIVEAMFSLETAGRITGDPALEDRLEKITFNALPAALTPDMKGLQYYTLPNNVVAIYGGHGFNQDYPNATLPGPDSGYPCCRYDFHMGWPRYVQNSWAATGDGGLAAMAYGPTVVNAMIAGTQVQITEDTGYPFEEQIRLHLAVGQPVAFPLKLRIPGWATNATVIVNGQPQTGVVAGTFLTLSNTWQPGDFVAINLPMTLQTETGPSRAVAIDRGPLVYSLRIGEDWTTNTPDPLGLGYNEYLIHPTTPWNYALQIDPTNPADDFAFTNLTTPPDPFDPAQNPITLTGQGAPLPGWTIGWRGTHAFEPPVSPVATTNALTTVTLVPFGSQHLRVSWFPYLGAPDPTVGAFAENFDSTWPRRWTVFGGNWVAKSNILSTVPASANGAKALAMATAFTNFTCEADVSVGAVGNAGLIFRVSRPDIGADAYCGYYAGISAQTGQLIVGCASNSWRSLTNAPLTVQANRFYHLKVQALGDRIRVFVDDTNSPLIDLRDGTFASGMVGVRDYCSDGDQSYSSFTHLTATEFPSGAPVMPGAWYPFEGNARDASGHGNDGTVTGAVTYPTGKLGAQAIQFDGGGSEYVTIPRSVSNDFTIAFWVKTTATGGTGQWYNGVGLVDGEMPGQTNDFGVALVGGKAAFGVGNPDTTIVSTGAVNDGQWHHIAATRDAATGQMKLFRDGVLEASAVGPTGTRNAPSNLKIGALQTLVPGSFLAGAIDDVQIFDYVVSDAGVPALMNHQPTLPPIFDAEILAGRTLTVTNAASDPDMPAQSLTYSLVAAPADVSINAATGTITWRPAISQSGQTYPIAVRVKDDGVPSLSATQTFNVVVTTPARPRLTAQADAGNFSMAVDGDVGPDYRVYASTNLAAAFANWALVFSTNPADLPFQFVTPLLPGQMQSFYRVMLGP